MAMSGSWRDDASVKVFSCRTAARTSTMQTVAGASQLISRSSSGRAGGGEKSRRLISVEGRRGFQEFN